MQPIREFRKIKIVITEEGDDNSSVNTELAVECLGIHHEQQEKHLEPSNQPRTRKALKNKEEQ